MTHKQKIEDAFDCFRTVVDRAPFLSNHEAEEVRYLYSKFRSPEELINVLLLRDGSIVKDKRRWETFLFHLCRITNDKESFWGIFEKHISQFDSIVMWKNFFIDRKHLQGAGQALDNISENEIKELFISKLNNSNDMKNQWLNLHPVDKKYLA